MPKLLKPSKTLSSKSVRPLPRQVKGKTEHLGRVHFIGIGGIGTSSLARWFLAQNWLVTGSDTVKSGITQDLVKDGIKVKIGHKMSNLPQNADLVVYSAAVPPENPELKEAKSLGIKMLRYGKALGDITKQYKTIAITGTHGKSSTTAIVASILIKAGMDPTVVIGSKMNGWNFRPGKSEWLIIESDEYKGSFWSHRPHSAIVTNIDLDHVDFYKNLDAVKNSFAKFLNSVSSEGYMVLNGDSENLVSIIPRIKQGNIVIFSAKDKERIEKIKKIIKVPGWHNIMNVLGAWRLAENLGIGEEIIKKAISEYKGIWRRMEYKGITRAGIKVYDDYAHHPTEVRATLQALREKFPKQKIVVCFEPHQQRRVNALYDDFVSCWEDADYVLLSDVYNPQGRDEVSKTKNSKSLAENINKISPGKAIYVGVDKKIPASLNNLPLKKGDVAVLMGAGTINNITPLLLRRSS